MSIRLVKLLPFHTKWFRFIQKYFANDIQLNYFLDRHVMDEFSLKCNEQNRNLTNDFRYPDLVYLEHGAEIFLDEL